MKIYSAKEAAEILEVSADRIRALCQAGRMGQKVGWSWIISEQDIERNRIREPGRPKSRPE